MASLPFLPLYVADYLSDTAHLTTEEHGAYMLLIMTYWQRGRALPADSARLANIARMSNDRWTSVERTLSEYFTVVNGEWQHERIEVELQRARDKVEKAKNAGKRSGEARSGGKSNGSTPPVQRPSNVRSASAQPTPQRTLDSTDTDTDREKRKDHTQSVRLDSSAARDSEPEPAGWQDLKKAFNGSTDAMLADVMRWMGPTAARRNAVNWLTSTLSAYGHERTARAWGILNAKQASGEIVSNPLGLWSRTAQGLKSEAVAGGSDKPRKSLTEVAAERAAKAKLQPQPELNRG